MRSYTDIVSWSKLWADIVNADRLIVTEKLDGANMRVGVVGGRVVFGSRGMVLETQDDIEKFYKGYPVEWFKRNWHVVEGLKQLAERLGGASVILFGEIVGWAIQKRIRYFLDPQRVEFYAFDLAVGDKPYLPYSEFLPLCEEFGIPVVPILYDGPPAGGEFNMLMESIDEQKSRIAEEDAPLEGYVIRTEPLYKTSLGCYSMAKVKASAFREGGDRPQARSDDAARAGGSKLLSFINEYVTEGRLHNVLTALRACGVPLQGHPSDLRYIVPAFMQDLEKECGAELEALRAGGISDKEISHRVGKLLQRMYITLLSEGV